MVGDRLRGEPKEHLECADNRTRVEGDFRQGNDADEDCHQD